MSKKSLQYAIRISEKLSEIFDEEDDNYISEDELREGENATHFLHALANIVPSAFYERLTAEEVDMIGFNHIANRLVFQYSKLEEDGKK